MGKLALIFPGQGSQSVGMGKDLFNNSLAGRETFIEIDDVVDRSLSQLCFEGPEDELKRTINTQPTVLAVSLAAFAAYKELGGPKPDYVAGHSLGEFTALCAADALKNYNAVKLVDKRARLMEECPPGAMSAVIGMDPKVLENSLREVSESILRSGNLNTEYDEAPTEQIVIVANYNTREQLVISGATGAVSEAGEVLRQKGAKIIALPVGGAFHSPLMNRAAYEFSNELEKFHFDNTVVEVVQNYDAKGSKSGSEMKSKLEKQMNNPVHWYESIEYMIANGVDRFVEIGPGKALTGMIKRINKDVQVFNISDSASLKATIDALKNPVVQAS